MGKSLHLLFDGTMINSFTNGIGNDSINLRDSVAKRYPGMKTLRFKNQPNFPGDTVRINNSRWLSNLKMLFFGSRESLNGFPDIFFQSQVNSLSAPNTTLTFTRIHDIFPITNPEWFSKKSVMFFNKCFSKIGSNNIYLCNSETTADSLRRYLSDQKAKIEVLHCAISGRNMICCNNCQGCNFQAPKDYGIAIGTLEPRKDYVTLLDSWKSTRMVNLQISLVIIGKYGWKQKKLARKLISHEGSKINWLSDACDGSVAKLRKSAKFFVSSSLNEGFNISAAEACNDRIPLLLSDIPVHRETHPEGYFFGPGDVLQLVERVEYLIKDGFSKPPPPTHLPYGESQFNSKLNQILDTYGV